MTFLKLFIRRNLIHNKLALLNIAGLTMGMFAFLFIFFYVYTETNYDQFLSNAKRIYHLEIEITKNGTNSLYSATPIPLGEAVYNEVAGIQNYSTYCSIFETSVLNTNESDFLNPAVLYANPGFVETFNFKAIAGNLKYALEPGKIIITRSAAIKYFGNSQIVGKSAKLLHDKKEPLLITIGAVIEDIPYNSNIQFEMVCHMDDYLNLVGHWVNSWDIKASQTYITLKKGADPAKVQQLIKTLTDKYINKKNTDTQGIASVFVRHISEKHFSKNYTLEHPTDRFVSKASLQILFLVGLVTLIISWLNYANLLTFQNISHFREIGIRKISGSSRRKIALNLLKESMLFTAIPILISIFFFFAFAPSLYKFFHFQSMDHICINNQWFWCFNTALLIFGSFLSSILPVFKIVKFKPIEMLSIKGVHTFRPSKKGTLLIFQFVLSIILICGIFGINQQMKFLNKKDLGFTKENTLIISPPITANISSYSQKMDAFKKEAVQIPGIVAMSAASSVPGKKLLTEHFGLKNKEETINKYLGVSNDGDYFDVIDARFLAGKNFSKNPELCQNEIIINQSLMHKLGISQPEAAINQPTNYGNSLIIGVIKDYNHTSLRENVKPTLYRFSLDRLIYFMIKFKKPVEKQQIEQLKSKWEKVFTNSPFEYSFLETGFNLQYQEEKQLSKVVLTFSLLSVFITILGLIGSCLNDTYMRTKEIGIRKVNGARSIELMMMLNRDFIKWVAIAFVIACPLAWLAIHKWLENFAFKTTMSWWIFPVTGIIALAIALLTVSWQSWSVATKNPVESLRYE